MTDVTTFTSEEIEKINQTKAMLQTYITNSKIFEYYAYNNIEHALIKAPVTDQDKTDMVIAGGSIASLLLNETVNDVDVFILNMNIDLFQDIISEKPGPWLVRYFFDEEEDTRQEDYKNPHVFGIATDSVRRLQYILTDHKSRKDLLADFDFLHCTASYYLDKLYINHETYNAIINKRLIRQHKNKAPKLNRAEKFIARGWKSEEDAMMATSKTLKEILQDKLDNVRGNTPVDAWKTASKNTSWDNTVNSLRDALYQEGQTSYSIHGPNITLNDITDELEELLHSK